MKISPQPNEPVPSSVSPLAPRPSALFATRQRQTNPWIPVFKPKNAAIVLLMLTLVNSAHADLSVSYSGKKVMLRSGEKEMARVLIPAKSDEEPAIDPQPELASVFGHGQRYRWKVIQQPGLEGEIWVSTYDLHGFVLVGGEFKVTGDKKIQIDELTPCLIEIERNDHDRSRFFINSGSQGMSGSLPLTDSHACQTVSDAIAQNANIILQPSSCSTLCAFRGVEESDCLGIGFVSVRRAEGYFGRQRKGNVFTVHPQIAYGGPELSPGQTLRIEALMINTDPRGGTYCLEEWARVATAVIQPKFNHTLVGIYNTWYAYWTPTSDHGTADLWLKGADELNSSGLTHYGINVTSAGVWQNRGAFGEHETWPNLIPKGWKWTVEEFKKRGGQVAHGGFWGHVSECSTVFKEHPEWMVRNKEGKPLQISKTSWGACDFPFYDLDVSIPEALAWLKEASVGEFAEWDTKFYWLDFHGYSARRAGGAVMADKTITWPTEAERLQLKMIRETIGEGCAIGVYTSPTNRLAGFVDRVRMSVDAGLVAAAPALTDEAAIQKYRAARIEGIRPVARNMAAAYFYNQKLWMNDPDPTAVGLLDQPETLEEARMRIMICSNSGGAATVGEAPSKMSPGRLALLKKSLPVYGHAARAIDMMDRDVATTHHLHVNHPDGDWEVVTLFNWDAEPKTFDLNVDRWGIVGPHHAFEFWTQTYAGVVDGRLKFEVPAFACRVIRLTRVANRPQIIGSDRHVAVGYFELPMMQWDRNALLGSAVRPQQEEGTFTVFVPAGWKTKSADGITDVSGDGSLLTWRLDFLPDGEAWRIAFVKSESKPE